MIPSAQPNPIGYIFFFGMLVLFPAFVIFLVAYGYTGLKRRKAAAAELAATYRLTAGVTHPCTVDRTVRFDLDGLWRGQGNTLWGNARNITFGRDNPTAPIWFTCQLNRPEGEHTFHTLTVLGLYIGGTIPGPVSVDPQHLTDLTLTDLTVESSTFNDAFRVRHYNKRVTHGIITPLMMEYLLTTPEAVNGWTLSRGWLLTTGLTEVVHSPGTLTFGGPKPTPTPTREYLTRIAALIPDYMKTEYNVTNGDNTYPLDVVTDFIPLLPLALEPGTHPIQ